jgi:hypothetical protein
MSSFLNNPKILATPLLPWTLATLLFPHPMNTHRRGGFLRQQRCCQPVVAPDGNTPAPLEGRGCCRGPLPGDTFSFVDGRQPAAIY